MNPCPRASRPSRNTWRLGLSLVLLGVGCQANGLSGVPVTPAAPTPAPTPSGVSPKVCCVPAATATPTPAPAATPSGNPTPPPTPTPSAAPTDTPVPTPTATATPTNANAPAPTATPAGTPAPPRVLMVVSNDGFYFQEYFDPRKELESAGAVVRVASGLGGPAYPHPGSYQPHKDPANDFAGGVVPTDEGARVIPATERLSDMQADDFDGLVIVGGWGASRYFFAYPGTYGGPVAQWAPDPAQATGMNRLVGAFVSARKQILAVCNGVNVLSWARIDGASPLAGKAVSAPWAAAPPQTYPHPYPAGPLVTFGSDYQVDRPCPPDPLSDCFPMERFARDNGALHQDPGGTRDQPQIGARDHAWSEDGIIITAQDNFAARTAAARFAERLFEGR